MTEIAGKMRNETVYQLKAMLSEEIALIGAYETLRKKLKRVGSPRYKPVLRIEETHRNIADRLIEAVESRGAIVATGPEDKLKLPQFKSKSTDTSDENGSLLALKEAEERGTKTCAIEQVEQVLDEASEVFITAILSERKVIVSQLESLIQGR